MRRIPEAVRIAFTLLAVTVLALVVTEIGLRLFFLARDARSGGQMARRADMRAIAEAHSGTPWNEALWNEYQRICQVEWQSYVYWRHIPFPGDSFRIEAGGRRRTWSDARAEENPASPLIYVFGGSTVWGWGVRDHHTIPSCLARDLAARNLPARVVNWGQAGYVTTQELIAMLRCLQSGDRPDLVIFYDGYNDVGASYYNRQAGVPLNEQNRMAEFNLLQSPDRVRALHYRQMAAGLGKTGFGRLAAALRRRLGGADDGGNPDAPVLRGAPPDTASLAEATVDAYKANVRMALLLARGYGVDALFYWHPVIFTKRQRTSPEEKGYESRRELAPLCLAVHERVRRDEDLRGTKEFRNVSHLFDEVSEPRYFDYVHLSEQGNAEMASSMVGDVIDVLERRRATRGAVAR